MSQQAAVYEVLRVRESIEISDRVFRQNKLDTVLMKALFPLGVNDNLRTGRTKAKH